MQLPIVGPAYQLPSIDINYQRCVNMYPINSGPEGRGGNALIPTAGLSLLYNLGPNPIRGSILVGNYLYVVYGTDIYKMYINTLTEEVESSTNIGSLNTGVGYVGMAINPTQIIFVDGTVNGKIYNYSTDTFSSITDNDFPASSDVIFMDGYFIVSEVDTGRFYTSALNDGTSWDAADVLTAENSTDNIVGLGKTKGDLWIFGTDSVDLYYNAGNASGSPFSPRRGLELQTGCGSVSSIVELDDLLIWLDNRGFIVQSNISPLVRDNNSGYDLKIISDEAITTAILSYNTFNDAIACGYNDRGHLMYQITFPTANKTWVFDYLSKTWHERSYYDSFSNTLKSHLGQYYTKLGPLHIMSGYRDGKLYLQKKDVYTDNGVDIRRIRTTSHQNLEFEFTTIHQVAIRMETGRAPVTGDGSDPYITLRYSNDGGHTWSNHMERSIGQIGEYSKPITWNRLGTARSWIFEFSLSDPIPFSIIEGYVKVSHKGNMAENS